MPFPHPVTIIIKGAGEMASGIAVRLHCAGFRRLLLLETPQPLAVRRAVSFSEAVYDGTQEVEGIVAERIEWEANVAPDSPAAKTLAATLHAVWNGKRLAVAVDPRWRLLSMLRPEVCVDAILAKENLGTGLADAPLVVALGPGFTAGKDAHYVVETNRGHNLGRVLASGSAQANTGIPGEIGGYSVERVLRAPVRGVVESGLPIGAEVVKGERVCLVGGVPVGSGVSGVVRGCIRSGIEVGAGVKIGDVDPRGVAEYCFTVSEKARALGGAVLEVLGAFLAARQGG